MKEVQSIPNASRTIEALRNLGYDFNSSVADLVDNAIPEKASAKNIFVHFTMQSTNSMKFLIQDDGNGMTNEVLEEAMRLGTDTQYGKNDLGKFGMGMKTASLSHCNKLTVISRRESVVSGYRWDTDYVKDRGWSLLQLEQNEIDDIITKENIKLGNHGTVVLWNDLVWIDKEYNSYDTEQLAQNYYFRLINDLKLHLRMVFHRFLDGSLGEKQTIRINVNYEQLYPWDPFCRQQRNTKKVSLSQGLTEFKALGYKCPIYINGFVLPTKEGFSSEKAWKEAKGLLSWNDSQGYYIYRANRIIRFGGWHGTKAKDEHDKLARISIDIDPSLDRLFRITVNKSRIEFPEMLFLHLKNQINPIVVRQAKNQYNKSERRSIVSNFRQKGEKVSRISRQMLIKSKITTRLLGHDAEGVIEVHNPSGTWLSNKIHEFLRYGSEKDYEIVSGILERDQLWRIVCKADDKFKVIINSTHPFYTRIYESEQNNRSTISAIDALIFSLAFAELYNKNQQNAHLFDTFKSVCSQSLEKIIEEQII